MSVLRGLTIIVVSGDPERFRAALTLACAQSALGGGARLFAHEGAAALFVAGEEEDAAALKTHGLPTRSDLLAMAVEAGVSLIACQTGLAIAGHQATDLPPGVETGGMIDILATLGEDRLVTI
ncbi:DsrE/DsrF/DrsH-like family protein [Sphingosinithalassobacter portus]|uniref:DsrE/DsrF/DrsH-like family protein n=1 Tax=Stakelama portus TaxID=2676234 RepID=UPI000D6E86DE|nr:DsrE/DsrF/DrsH-like family protein [Sphingosinithalassobacter portus]